MHAVVRACGRILARLPAMLGTHLSVEDAPKLQGLAVGPRPDRADVRNLAMGSANDPRQPKGTARTLAGTMGGADAVLHRYLIASHRYTKHRRWASYEGKR
jgi:hypothetical protein